MQLRNTYRGHAFVETPAKSTWVTKQVELALYDLIEECGYLKQHLMFELRNCERSRKGVMLTRLILSHDNPEFQTQRIVRPIGNRSEHNPVSEVYLDVGDDYWLPLWPWIRVVPDLAGNATIGVFDGLKTNATVYCRVLGGGVAEPDDEQREKWEDPTEIADVRGYMGFDVT